MLFRFRGWGKSQGQVKPKIKFRPVLEEMESRVVPADLPGAPPGGPVVVVPQAITVPDSSGAYQVYIPTTLNLLANVVDPNPGAQLVFSTINIVTPPVRGTVDFDPNNGRFLYTPNYLRPPGLAPGQVPGTVLPESFQFTIRDSVGAMSNVATFTFNGANAPGKEGNIIAHDGFGVTPSLQPVTIDLLSRIEVKPGYEVNLASLALDPTSLPQHGTVRIDPATGKLTYTPAFGYVGFDIFSYTVSDTTGLWNSTAEVYVRIQTAAPRLQADPLGGQMLIVDGTSGDDKIVITAGRKHGDVVVSVNGVISGPFHPTSRVVVFGYGGNDRVEVANRVKSTAWLVGGDGNDTLGAGAGPSVLLGGDGNDYLVAGTERALLIGGAGTDSLLGNGDDILVAGTTSFDANQASLDAILKEWNSNHSYTQRVQNLTGQVHRAFSRRLNGNTLLTLANIQDDGAADLVYAGRSKNNLFYVTLGGTTGDSLVATSNHHRDTVFALLGQPAPAAAGSPAATQPHHTPRAVKRHR
jgi:hypothetical protein